MKRLLLVVASLLIIFTCMFVVADHLGYTDEAFARAELLGLKERPGGSWLLAGGVIGILTLDLFFPVPSSVVMMVSGAAFGVVGGSLIAFVGAMGAAILGFGLCRWRGQGVFQRLVGDEDVRHIDTWFTEWGVAAILLSRPIPMMTEVLSCLAGLTDLPWRTFLAATAAGTLPVCLIYAWAGVESSFENPWPAILTALGIPAVGWVVTFELKRRRRRAE